jgi:hypothetical protein
MKKVYFFSILVVISLWCLSGCNNSSPRFSDKHVEEGYHLAQTYCKSCHQFPEPALLNKVTWANHILPKMGEFIGFRYLGLNSYVENGNTEVMKLEQWNKIVQYYTTQSPAELAIANVQKIGMELKQFNVQIPSFGVKHPATTMVNVGSSTRNYFFGDGVTQQVYAMSPGNSIADSFKVAIGVSNLHVTDTAMFVLTMGVMQPSDSKDGKLLSINSHTKKTDTLLDSLQRPVSATYADLNNDNLEDIIVCEFGNTTGQLSWFENSGTGKFIKHSLRPLPGAVKTVVYDFNRDGKPDIMAMMAQGDESVFIYFNQGNNTFKEERVLQLPPSYGSNYFELADFNGDGYQDIIATNGDNGDYPPILKPYHGIRIYLNDGKNNFKEEVFLPVNGIGKAIAKDFDGDGDLDIVSIAFFPDYKNTPEESFIYWENKGRLSFRPSSFSEATAGRWITMDAGDIDGDGDIDIVLGNANFSIGAVPGIFKTKWDAYTPSILILRNTLH